MSKTWLTFANLQECEYLERAHGTCMQYGDVLWMMGVTITNLGYGDFTPSNYISRIIISILSLLGTLLNNMFGFRDMF